MRESLGGKPTGVMKVKRVGARAVVSAACTIDRSGWTLKDLSKSAHVGTRKMVNYA
jgi:hypothetical protein